MIYLFYNIFVIFLASSLFPFLLIYLFKTGKIPYFFQYFGYYGKHRKEIHHLFHAVSVGEAKSIIEVSRRLEGKSVITTTCIPVINYLKRNYPECECVFYPLDTKFTVRLLLDTFKVRGVYISEVDYWPCLLKEARDRMLPVCILNARISEGTYRFMSFFRSFWVELFKGVDMIIVQNQNMNRYFETFVEKRKLLFLGNLKFENNLDKTSDKKGLFIAGSTHWPEEKYILEAADKIDIRTVIAPRNMSSIDNILAYAKSKNIDVSLYSEKGMAEKIIIMDTFGILSSLYKDALFSYVGGGFTRTGVHSFLEPASYGCPFFIGPNIKNFKVEAEEFDEVLIKVNKIEDIKDKIIDLYKDKQSVQSKTEKIKSIVMKNSGVAKKIAKFIMVNMYG
ncbi:MAG: hypothetical protein C0601_04545 [Candidatus Muiribacterium halophilum]|uniref:3-deoxy-D-manno-octulosonic acid transferase n=1 Tax=Muiribacterium halophilum TaxID=2053465 RepID=A0A2N5ZII0_MUIH1|nr:MAG: hypothetical protein C0601_04545 [Candidatus Muirbacterium halophilum]